MHCFPKIKIAFNVWNIWKNKRRTTQNLNVDKLFDLLVGWFGTDAQSLTIEKGANDPFFFFLWFHSAKWKKITNHIAKWKLTVKTIRRVLFINTFSTYTFELIMDFLTFSIFHRYEKVTVIQEESIWWTQDDILKMTLYFCVVKSPFFVGVVVIFIVYFFLLRLLNKHSKNPAQIL